jgi:predicted nucleic acid-binding protein
VNAVFLDTFFLLAAINPADTYHEQALAWSDAYDGPFLTTAWVITEVADALAGPAHRRIFATYYEALRAEERVRIIPPDAACWERGLRLYFERPDKEWSLTDCISFTVMREEGLTEALTGDRHFEQAGFSALLRAITP